MAYEIITYDVWGNAKDGWEVNDAYRTGRHVRIRPDASDYAINRAVGLRGVQWDGDPEYGLYGTFKRTGRPALELRPSTNGD